MTYFLIIIAIIIISIYLKRKYRPNLWRVCYKYLINSLSIEEKYNYNSSGRFSKVIQLDNFRLELYRNHGDEKIFLENSIDNKILYRMEVGFMETYHNGRISKKEFRQILKQYKIY